MKRKIYILLLMITAWGCRKPYNPPAISQPASMLVVEGVINTNGTTLIKLSGTVNLASTATQNPVTGAVTTIEDNQNSIYPLLETQTGTYASQNLTLDNTRQYRLRIKTADGKQYLSDFEAVKITPPIDSVGYKVVNNTVQLYVNSHDPNNNTRYYRWDYSETWKFHSKYLSDYIYDGISKIVPRTPAQYVYFCYASDTSSTIVLGSSAQLKQDVIYQQPLTNILSTSEKVETEYSILVNEYALTGDAFNFWTNLKKTTEQLGSIFDPQPVNIKGNIHNINNAAEPVIGYISISSVQSKRIFITEAQLPQTWQPTYPYDCELDTNYFSKPKSGENQVLENLLNNDNINIPTEPFYIGGFVAGYLSSDLICIDCTLRGTKTVPAFWK